MHFIEIRRSCRGGFGSHAGSHLYWLGGIRTCPERVVEEVTRQSIRTEIDNMGDLYGQQRNAYMHEPIFQQHGFFVVVLEGYVDELQATRVGDGISLADND